MSPISKIKKRNSETVPFETSKILRGLEKAAIASGKTKLQSQEIAESMLQKLLAYLNIFTSTETTAQVVINTTQLKALIINILKENNHRDIAVQYEKHEKKTKNFSAKSENLALNNQFLEKISPRLNLEKFLQELSEKLADTGEEKVIYQLLTRQHFLPNFNFLKGNSAIESMSLILEDNLENIFDNLTKCALNYQKGITTNINFSKLRPKNSHISSNNQISSGPVSFMKIFTTTIEALKEGSAENLPQNIILNIEHPDIIEFILFAKKAHNKDLKFVIQLTQAFLDALEQNLDYDLISPLTAKTVNTLNAKSIFDLIANTIRESNSLGLRLENQPSENQAIISGFINLSSFVKEKQFDFKAFKQTVTATESCLMKMSSQEKVLMKKTLHMYLNGYAEMLVKLDINYNSVQCLQLTEKILAFFDENITRNTTKKTGKNTTEKVTENTAEKTIEKINPHIVQTGVKIENQISNIWNNSPGIEALKTLGTIKKSLDGLENFSIHPLLETKLRSDNILNRELVKEIAFNNSLSIIDSLDEKIKKLFITEQEIEPEWHLKIQAIFEKYLTGPIEKKLYLNQNLGIEDIKKLYRKAFKSGCRTIEYLEIEKIEDLPQEQIDSTQKKFLLNLAHFKKNSKKIQVQPQLFPLKKTEEVALPPINSSIK